MIVPACQHSSDLPQGFIVLTCGQFDFHCMGWVYDEVPFCSTIVYCVNGNSKILNWRYLPYIRPFFKAYGREYPQNIWPYMVQYLHFRILKFPLIVLPPSTGAAPKFGPQHGSV